MPITNNTPLPNKIKEMVLAELRSVKAIQTDYSKVIDAMEKHLEAYKKSKGTPAEKEHIQKLKTLTSQKKKLADELNAKVSDMYKDAELKVDEMNTTGGVEGYNTPFAFSGKDSEEKKGKRQADLTGYSVVKEETASDIIKDLDKVKNDLIKKVDVLIAKKKKLYSNVDITTPMSADEKKLNKDIADLFSEINTLVLQKRSLKKASVNEGKYYVTYNRGRGQGKGLEMQSDPKTFKPTGKPKVFSSYNDAKKYAEKMEKIFRNSIGGSTAYWVSDEKMNPIKESVNESDLKGYLVADVVDDIIKSIGTRFVSGEIKQSNKNKIYLKLKDVKFGSGVVKILKSRFGIDAKEEMFGGKDKFGSIPSVSFFANKVVSESVNEEEKSTEEILMGLRQMAMGDLERIADYANMIETRMKKGQELSSWMYSQITLAVDQLNSVHDSMDGKDGEREPMKESHFKVGDKVKMSHGGIGIVKSLDKKDGADNEKYYSVELPNGEIHKHSPNELSSFK